MLFNSLEFLLFFALVLVVVPLLGHRAQNRFLLVASLWFYASWNFQLLGLLIGSATIDYLCALGLEASRDPRRRRLFLTASLCSNLAILGCFKYADFFLASAQELGTALGFELSVPLLRVALPVGISFYTFQAMSYAVDVYRGELRACRDYFDYLLYISFFPQLVAGPIERGTHLLPQVKKPRPRPNLGARVEGVKLMVLGYFQKIAIADVLAPRVDEVFAAPGEHGALALILGLYAFAVQIYCDFAGYSNIARGAARLLGFRLMVNFAQPYLAPDITEFWRRWHISLSTWLRDYLYIPLGGNRRGKARTYFNLMVTMLLGGLWHGASWTFVVWGGLHGVFLAVHKALGGGAREVRSPARRAVGGVLTFHLVCLAWLFFRADDFATALAYLRGIFAPLGAWDPKLVEVAAYVLAALALDLLLQRRARAHLAVLFSRRWALEACLLALVLALTLFVGDNHVVPFIYFQF